MTTKVLIVNHGPDQVLVRTVEYGPDVKLPPGEKPKAVDDRYIAPQEDCLFWVHRNQQLLIGEKQSRTEVESKEVNLPSDKS